MKGLYPKYKITRLDGTPADLDAQYFVLRLDSDRHARVAARAYAESIRQDNPLLCDDLNRQLDRLKTWTL